MKTINLAENVSLHLHETEKFNDITVSFRYKNSLENTNRTARTYLTQLLNDSCCAYPTKEAVTRCFDTLYGSNFKVISDNLGKLDIIEFRLSTLNGNVVHEDLLTKQIDVLSEFINNPKIVNGLFDETLFNEMRERLILMIQSFHDQPGNHASDQAKRLFNPSQKCKALPTVDDVKNCSNEDVVKAYHQLMNEDALDIFVLGDFDDEEVLDLIQTKFKFSSRKPIQEVIDLNTKETFEEIIEHKAISQTRVVMMFTTNQTMLDESYPAILLANGLFGTFPTSFLFQEVREKRSLCYSISSRIDNYDGIISVATAIDGANFEQVRDLVLEQVRRIKQGDFSDELLETTRKMYINVLRSSIDSQKSLLTLDYREILLNESLNVNRVLERIRQCTKEDIINAFQQVEPKLTYCLMQEGQHE